jgi:hypothetical protein
MARSLKIYFISKKQYITRSCIKTYGYEYLFSNKNTLIKVISKQNIHIIFKWLKFVLVITVYSSLKIH